MMASSARRRTFLLLLGASAVALACSKDKSEPEDPVWGKEPCAHCAMIVSDKRLAAQAISTAGDRKFFDDIGCMVLWLEEPRQKQVAAERTWVRDGTTGGRWLDARSAHYVDGAKTPMDFGFEAKPPTIGGGIGWNEMKDRVLAIAKRNRGEAPQ